MAVVYASIRRLGPWKYALTYELISDGEETLAEGEVLDRCLAKLEREIALDPRAGCGRTSGGSTTDLSRVPCIHDVTARNPKLGKCTPCKETRRWLSG